MMRFAETMTSIKPVSAAELVADGLAGDREAQIHQLKK